MFRLAVILPIALLTVLNPAETFSEESPFQSVAKLQSVRYYLGMNCDDEVPPPAVDQKLHDSRLVVRLSDANYPLLEIAEPNDIETGRDWLEAVESGRTIVLRRQPEEDRIEGLQLQIETKEPANHPWWNGRVLVVGVADDGVEWVLASRTAPSAAPIPLGDGKLNVELPKGARDSNLLSFILRSDRPPKPTALDAPSNAAQVEIVPTPELTTESGAVRLAGKVTLQIRYHGDKSKIPAIVASYEISRNSQWVILEKEARGLSLAYPPVGPQTRRFIFEAASKSFELVAFSGTPIKPGDADLGEWRLELTGVAVDKVKSSLIDRTAPPQERPSQLYGEFSEAREWVWKFNDVSKLDSQ
jgi:hypothetical protein